MVNVRPFVGVRYDPKVVGDLSRVVAAPYDVITPTAQRDYYARSPDNVVRLELGLETAADTSTDNRYTRAAAVYEEWRRGGVLRPETTTGFYVYDELVDESPTPLVRRSLVAPVRLASWDENVVLPHEYTMPKPKADRLQLLAATHTQFSPLLGMYDDPGGILRALAGATAEAPVAELVLPAGSIAAAARAHRLWRIASPDLAAELREALASLQIYIADGHHRYETALTYRDQRRRAGAAPDAASEYVLMALVETGDPGLLLFPTHRLVRDLDAVDRERLLLALPRWFELATRPVPRGDPAALRQAVATLGQEAATADRPSFVAVGLRPDAVHRLTLRSDVDLARELPDVPTVFRNLDAVLLQRLILERELGVSAEDAEGSQRLSYARDSAEALAAFDAGEAQLVFLLNPTPVSLIREAARAGVRMPQKTTYFYPKPLTGLVFFDHDVAWGTADGER